MVPPAHGKMSSVPECWVPDASTLPEPPREDSGRTATQDDSTNTSTVVHTGASRVLRSISVPSHILCNYLLGSRRRYGANQYLFIYLVFTNSFQAERVCVDGQTAE